MKNVEIDETHISETAYLYWLDDGQPQGHDQAHWLRAVDVLNQPALKAKPTRKAAVKPRSAAVPKRNMKPKAKAKTTAT